MVPVIIVGIITYALVLPFLGDEKWWFLMGTALSAGLAALSGFDPLWGFVSLVIGGGVTGYIREQVEEKQRRNK